MVIRHYIKCDTCNTPHTLRIGLGHNDWQEHTFPCVECGEDISVGVKLDFENISTDLKCISNCKIGSEEGSIVNLHPELAINKDSLHKDYAFPFLENMANKIFDHPEGTPNVPHDKFEEILEESKRRTYFKEEWDTLKKAWSLQLKGRADIANTIKEETISQFGYNDEVTNINDWVFRFSYRILSPSQLSLFHNIAGVTKKSNELHSDEFLKFKKYYIDNFFIEQYQRYFDIYSEYFLNYSEYGQTLFYQKFKKELPDKFEVSSLSFKKTKMFYGNAFESLSTNIVVLACINNINCGRSFDQFQTMDLKKYMTINKANRATPFKDVEEFVALTDCLDSTLRNASHHGGMKFDSKNKKIIYRSGGTGSEREMSYKEYLFKCNDILFASSALLMLELMIAF
ncbi:MAG: hypothetical protein AB7S75_06940 [Desulfococcaceae bacterium]